MKGQREAMEREKMENKYTSMNEIREWIRENTEKEISQYGIFRGIGFPLTTLQKRFIWYHMISKDDGMITVKNHPTINGWEIAFRSYYGSQWERTSPIGSGCYVWSGYAITNVELVCTGNRIQGMLDGLEYKRKDR